MIREPIYYKNFRCIAGDCTDSCCKGWEIDIDEDTLEYYEGLTGQFGDRIKNEIVLGAVDEDGEEEPPHFSLKEGKRCPFLNDRGLCDIILELGEEAISEVCTNHPRYYDWMEQVTEAGVGLCCQEAARLILTGESMGRLTMEPDDENCEEISELDEMLFGMREDCFELIRDRRLSWEDTSKKLLDLAEEEEEKLEAYLYGETEDDREAEDDENIGDEGFWRVTNLKATLQYYLDLDINTEEWQDMILEALPDEMLEKIRESRSEFEAAHPECIDQYRRLLIYFIYRYFMRARYDEEIVARIRFALISVYMIETMDILRWIKKDRGDFTLWDQVCVCKLYSQEIEYDSENVDKITFDGFGSNRF